jgi:hypothetical protein
MNGTDLAPVGEYFAIVDPVLRYAPVASAASGTSKIEEATTTG